jgi:hypothetical protein
MIASLKSERLKTPNEGSKPEFHLRWIRELVLVRDPEVGTLCFAEFLGTTRFPESDRLIACLCVRLAAAVASAAGRVAGNTCA